MIFRALDDSYDKDKKDQICFALSCIHIIQISAVHDLYVRTVGHSRKHFDHEDKEKRLAFLKLLAPLTKRGRKSKAFALCEKCMAYRPTTKKFWKAKAKEDDFLEVTGDALAEMATMFKNGEYLRCPECWYERNMTTPYPKDG